MNNIRSTLATVWRIAAPISVPRTNGPAAALLAAVISIELGAGRDRRAAEPVEQPLLQRAAGRNWDVFVREIGVFCVLAACFIVLAVYQLYLNQWLQIRWRRWLTSHYLGEWLHGANHYRMQLQGDAADNPDQRIADDVKLFVERTLDIGLNLLEFAGDAAFVRRHPVGTVGSRATARVRQGISRSRATWSGAR